MDTIKAKAENMSKRLNKIADSLSKQSNVEFKQVEPQDVTEYAVAKLPVASDLDGVNLPSMLEDFAYVRAVLKENTECARNMLEHVSGNMLDEDDNVTPGMITAFSELNKSITENMRLYVSSYKDLTASINNARSHSNVTNNLNIINSDKNITSVKDIIEKLKGQNES